VNAPNPIVPQHTRPVAYLGGVGVAAGAASGACAAVAAGAALALPAGAYVGFSLFLALGAYDDLRPLGAGEKLGLQCAIAAAAAALGLVAPVTTVVAVDLVLATGAIVLLVNAVNLTDVCDGLVAGLAALAFATWGVLDPTLRPAAWALSGGCVGFLLFNRPPASIFLGDAGSHALGFALATLALVSAERRGDAVPLAAGALLSGVFLFELAFLVRVRARKGLPVWRGSPDHFALRLQARGLGRGATDLVAWSAGLLCGIAALRFVEAGALERALWPLVLGALGALCARKILPWEVRGPPETGSEPWVASTQAGRPSP